MPSSDFNPRRPRGRRRAHFCIPPALGPRISTHAARAGGDQLQPFIGTSSTYFNPRRPRGRRPHARGYHRAYMYFNPRRPRGRRPELRATASAVYFNPRRPRGRRRRACYPDTDRVHFNPRRPRGRRRADSFVARQCHDISTHAARAGGDVLAALWQCSAFQPTPPARAATCPHTDLRQFQPTPPARAATRLLAEAIGNGISTHAARAGGDSAAVTRAASQCISTHAARAGGDNGSRYGCHGCRYFNPRRPRGRRRSTAQIPLLQSESFQPTPPARAATPPLDRPRAIAYFNPRRPRGRRRSRFLPHRCR